MQRVCWLFSWILLIGSVGCGNVSESRASSKTQPQAAEVVSNDQSPVSDAAEASPPAETAVKSAEVASTPADIQGNSTLYVPVESDFQVTYLADEKNREKQTQAEYWRWVKAFYHGEFLITGWLRQSESILKLCHQSPDRPAVVGLLNDAGRKLAAEWSKDGSVRKINNIDLQTWGSRISKCSGSPQESTECVKNALLEILEEIERKLGS